MRAEDTRAARELLVLGLVVAAGVFAAPQLRDVFNAERGRPRTAAVACPPPSEHEKLLIVVSMQDGKLAGECMYVGTRGTYTRRSVRQVSAQ